MAGLLVRSDELLTRLLRPRLSRNKKGFEWSCDQTGKKTGQVVPEPSLPVFEGNGLYVKLLGSFFFAHGPKLNCLALRVSTAEGRVKF